MLISTLGVNALSGVSTHSIEPPKFGVKQDYVVVGQQPWLDGIVSGPGIVRQVSKFLHSRGLRFLNNISLLRLILAQDIQLKNKLLGKPKLAASSLIFFRVDLGWMGCSFGKEEKSTVFHLLQNSGWWATNFSYIGDYSLLCIFLLYAVSHKLDEVLEYQQKFQARRMPRILPNQDFLFEMTQMSGLCLITSVGFRPRPPLRLRTKASRQQQHILDLRVNVRD